MSRKAPDLIDIHVGNRARMRRMMMGMSQGTLGGQLGLSFQQVHRYEVGKNRVGAGRLQRIAEVLQVPMTFFFEGAPNLVESAPDSMRGAQSPAYLWDFLATPEGLALVNAFRRVKDAKLGRAIVKLVEAIAGEVNCGVGNE